MARRILGFAVLFLVTGMLLPGSVRGQNKAAPGGDVESDKLNPGSFTGKLKGAVSPAADFELEIEIKSLEINPQALQGRGGNNNNQNVQNMLRTQQQIAQAQQRMAQARNPQEQAQAMQQLQRTMQQVQQNQIRQLQQGQRGGNNGGNNAVKVVTQTKTIDFHASPDLVIRRSQPAMEFDEKGNLRTLSPENLRLMKGDDPRLPGYQAKLEDLKPGAIVSVTMKRAVMNDPKAILDPNAHKNVVTLIMIERDGQDPAVKGKKK